MDMNSTIRPVEARHERVANGVRFNVETVKELGKKLEPGWYGVSIEEAAEKFYEENTLKIRVESDGFSRETAVLGGSLVDIALKAFADHYPLVLRADDIWV